MTWPVLARLAVDLVGRWRDRRDLTLLPAIITVHDGQAHAIRFGDRDGDVQPLPADADGLHTVAGPLWPWQVTMRPLIAGRDSVAAEGSRGPDRCPGDGGAGWPSLSAPQCGGAPNDEPCRVDRRLTCATAASTVGRSTAGHPYAPTAFHQPRPADTGTGVPARAAFASRDRT
ncbi:hypothetical protein [Polymorphospora sp. NPDC050346]|uniref:hypothetical protein n=1 Tax=Polymorphospora sp. NPDC050346 TaxID=3155780 RepID=UPI0033CE2FAB